MAKKKKKSKKKNTKPMTEEERQKILARFSQTSVTKKEVVIEEKQINIDVRDDLRAPICCVLGHVDAGKTSLLDALRKSNVCDGEQGKITQQIGASFFPISSIQQITSAIKGKFKVEHNIPGMLMIDTPGHESFHNLRERGSSLCDIAILVVDIEDGVMPQTKDSIKLLLEKKIPFVIAATKLDKVWNWEKQDVLNLRASYKKQSEESRNSLMGYMEGIKSNMKDEGVDSEFYFSNKKPKKIYSIVPVCSLSGEGIADILALLVFMTQKWMEQKITYHENKSRAIIMEINQEKGYGWTADSILIDGQIKVGDKYIVSANDGPREITIKNILTPPPLTQLKNKTKWTQHQQVKAAAGIKLIASGFEGVYAGTKLHPVLKDKNKALDKAREEIEQFWNNFKLTDSGVWVQAPTLGSLEACMHLLETKEIPVKGFFVGELAEKDLNKLLAAYENEEKTEHKCLLYFGKITLKNIGDLTIQQWTQVNQFNIIHSEIVYQLEDQFQKFMKEVQESRRKTLEDTSDVFFPAELTILPKFIFLNGGKDDLLIGMKVKGRLKKGAKLCFINKELKPSSLGIVTSIEKNNKVVDMAKNGDEVCVRLDNPNNLSYDRQFTKSDLIITELNRSIINNLKDNYQDDMKNEDWIMVINQKKLLKIR